MDAAPLPRKPHYPAVQRNAKRARRSNKVRKIDLTEEQWHNILMAYDYKCAYCGADLNPPTMDHIRPISRGGPHSASNVIPACSECNTRKGSDYLKHFLRPSNKEATLPLEQ